MRLHSPMALKRHAPSSFIFLMVNPFFFSAFSNHCSCFNTTHTHMTLGVTHTTHTTHTHVTLGDTHNCPLSLTHNCPLSHPNIHTTTVFPYIHT